MSTASKVERTAIHLPTQPILGDPSCTTNPTDCCDGGESIAGVTLTVEKRRWTLPAGAWIGETWCEDFETCCDASGSASTGPILTACCDYPLNTTLTCLATIGGITTIYNANWNGSYWVVDHPSMYALRCNGTTWEVGYNSGGMVWTAASGRCTPDFFWGITVGGDSISFVGSAGDESMPGGATYRLRVQKTRVYLPATATVGDPRCVDEPQDCCEDRITPDCCPTSSIGEVIYAAFSNVSGGCTDLEGVVVPMVYSAGGWYGCVAYKLQYPDSAIMLAVCTVTTQLVCGDSGSLLFTVLFEYKQYLPIIPLPTLDEIECNNDGATVCFTDNTDSMTIPCPSGELFSVFTGRAVEFEQTIGGGPCIFDPNPCCNTINFDVTVFE